MNLCVYSMPITVATQSEAWVCSPLLLGWRVRIPSGVLLSLVSAVCRQIEICVGMATRTEEPYRVWFV